MTSALQSLRAKHGNETERFVETLNHLCELRGIARLRKVPTEMRVVGRQGPRVVAIYAKKAGVDYVGRFIGSGRFVGVEVKRVDVSISKRTGAPLPPHLDLARVEDHQRAELDAIAADGGLALLLVVHGPLAAYAVPWAEARRVRDNGGGVLSGVFLERWRVRAGVPYLEPFTEGESMKTANGADR